MRKHLILLFDPRTKNSFVIAFLLVQSIYIFGSTFKQRINDVQRQRTQTFFFILPNLE
jgi:hypothetical protein